jgi:citrate lyase subunit beta / citryl-CoA lyase
LHTDVQRARRLGFGGKLCIHPKQVAGVHRGFAPSADELAWAHRVLDASAAAGGATIAADGKMVDKPVLLHAERLLREGAALSRPEARP